MYILQGWKVCYKPLYMHILQGWKVCYKSLYICIYSKVGNYVINLYIYIYKYSKVGKYILNLYIYILQGWKICSNNERHLSSVSSKNWYVLYLALFFLLGTAVRSINRIYNFLYSNLISSVFNNKNMDI